MIFLLCLLILGASAEDTSYEDQLAQINAGYDKAIAEVNNPTPATPATASEGYYSPTSDKLGEAGPLIDACPNECRSAKGATPDPVCLGQCVRRAIKGDEPKQDSMMPMLMMMMSGGGESEGSGAEAGGGGEAIPGEGGEIANPMSDMGM